MDPKELISLGAAPFVIGITQLWKDTVPTAPTWATVAVAFVSAEALTEAFTYLNHGDYVVGAIMGLMTWLSSMGVWSAVKSTLFAPKA